MCKNMLIWFKKKASFKNWFASGMRMLIILAVILAILVCTFSSQLIGLFVVWITGMCVNMLKNNVHVWISIECFTQINEISLICQRLTICLTKTILLPTPQTLRYWINQKLRIAIDAYSIEASFAAIPYCTYRCLNFTSIIRCTTSYRCTNIPIQS